MNTNPWGYCIPDAVVNPFGEISHSDSSDNSFCSSPYQSGHFSYPTEISPVFGPAFEPRDVYAQRDINVHAFQFYSPPVSYQSSRATRKSNVYPPVHPFTERKAICEKIKEELFREGIPMVAVAGMVGVGKTETARYFVKEFCHQMYTNIVWINAETRTSVVDTLQQFAYEKLHWSVDNVGHNLRFVHKAVQEICREKTLLIFDNASSNSSGSKGSEEFDIISFIEQTLVLGTNVGILITTRSLTWTSPVKVVTVDLFNKEECFSYVSSHIADVEDFHNWKKLSRLCGQLPITLEVATQSIKEARALALNSGGPPYTIDKFLEQCKNQPGTTRHMVTRSSVINSVFKQLKQQQAEDSPALRMITAMSFLSPNGVPRSLLLSLLAKGDLNVETMPGFPEAIVLLTSQSLMKKSECGKYFYVHRFIQGARVKFLEDTRVMEKEADSFSQYFLDILKLVHSKMPNYVNYLEHAVHSCRVLSEYLHLRSVQELFKITSYMYEGMHLPTCITLKSKLLKSVPQGKLKRSHQVDLAKTLKHVDPKQCSDLLEPIVAQLNSGKLKEDRSFEFKVRRLYAYSLQKRGQYIESKASYATLMQLHNIYSGCNGIEKLETQYDIGVLYISMGKHKDAYEQLADIYLSTKDEGYETEVNIKSHLRIAECLKLLCRYDESWSVYCQIYAFQRRKYTEDHPFTMTTQSEMADVLIKKNCFKEAAKILMAVCQRQNRLLGSDHPATLITRCRLAEINLEQGEYDAAGKSLQDVLQIQKITLGEGHPATLATTFLIGEFYKRVGILEEAEKIFSKVYLGRVTALTNQHPDTLDAHGKLGEVQMEQKAFDEARFCFGKIWIEKERSYGQNHPSVLLLRIQIGLTFLLEGKIKHALERFSGVHENCLEFLDASHEVTLIAALNIGIALREQKSNKRNSLKPVLQHFANVLMQAQITRDWRHPLVLQVEYEVGITLEMNGNDKGARCQFIKVYEAQEQVLGPDNLDTLKTRQHLAFVLQKLRKFDLAQVIFNDILRRRTNILGAEHKLTVETESCLSKLQLMRGGVTSSPVKTNKPEAIIEAEKKRLENYLTFIKNSYSEWERQYGQTDPQVLRALHCKGATLRSLRRPAEALPILKDALEKRRAFLGENHKDFQATSREYAHVLLDMGQYKEAHDLSFRTLMSMINTPSLMTFNYDVVSSKRLVVACLFKLGHYDRALTCAENVLYECQQMTEDKYSSDILQALHVTADIFTAQENFESALSRCDAVFQIRHKQLGLQLHDPQVLSSRHQKAVIAFRTGQIARASTYFESIVKDRERVLGAEHPDTLESKFWYAVVLQQSRQQHKQALTILDSICSIRETTLGQYHPDTMEVKRFQALGTAATGDVHVALRNLEDLLKKFKESLGETHPLTWSCTNSVMYVSSLKKRILPKSMTVNNGAASVFGLIRGVANCYVESAASKAHEVTSYFKRK